jgi:hypothetical protein
MVELKRKRKPSMRDAAVMSVIKDRLYEEVKKVNSDIEVRYTYGYQTSWKRRLLHIEKSHVSDARVISGNGYVDYDNCMWVLTQLRRHNRQIHKANILKGGRLKRCQSAYDINGFRLWDVVRYDGKLWFINGKRTSGYFSLSGYGQNYDKIGGVSYRKLRLVGLSNRLRKEYIIGQFTYPS